jgi:membrane associated rhomboid family serine protease
MIFPWLRGLLGRDRAPLTWTLAFLCFYLFIALFGGMNWDAREFFYKQDSLELTGKIYYQFIGSRGNPPLNDLFPLAYRGLSDPRFIETADQLHFDGDEVQIKEWQSKLKDYRRALGILPSILFGLSGKFHGLPNLITYQFLHSGVFHLASNMFLLMIFGGAVELLVGSLGVVLIFLTSGIAGGLLFMALSGNTLSPVIGASGSISGLMAFYAVYEFRKAVPFFYFISPLPGYYGLIYLPRLLIFPLFFLADFSSLWADGMDSVGGWGAFTTQGGVAYGAHLGGLLFGASLGWMAKAYRTHRALPKVFSQYLPE